MEQYMLEKPVWTTDDIDQMGWHDCPIHAIAFDDSNNKLLFDIDYIFKWVAPSESGHYGFWIAPATLVFENVYGLAADFGSMLQQTILEFDRSNPVKPHKLSCIEYDVEWEWTILTVCGQITFKSVGYTQYIRKSPVYKEIQEISLEERGGFSFSTETEV
jgi:hypothetical protein